MSGALEKVSHISRSCAVGRFGAWSHRPVEPSFTYAKDWVDYTMG